MNDSKKRTGNFLCNIPTSCALVQNRNVVAFHAVSPFYIIHIMRKIHQHAVKCIFGLIGYTVSIL